MVTVPRLDTERTLMREWREEDLDAFAAMVADPETMRFLGGVGTREDAWRGIALHVGHWQLRGYGTWAVQRREDGAFIGRVGLWNPEGWPALEVGWTLARGAWGLGLATETARAAMRWAWDDLRAERLISLIAVDNGPSIRVAERLGMVPGRRDEHRGIPVVIYEVARPA
jgi:RimJ/RimL family protein N-acetyltransferase